MKLYKDKEINKILTSDSSGLKRKLKIKEDENYLEQLLEICAKLLRNIEDKFIPVIEVILNEIEIISLTKKDTYPQKSENSLIFRRNLSVIYDIINNKQKNGTIFYDCFEEFKDVLDRIENNFDNLIKSSSVLNNVDDYDEISELLRFFATQINNLDLYNNDIVNKILSSLELLSKKDVFIDINYLKEMQRIVKEKQSFNESVNYTYILGKLSLIENNIKNGKNKLLKKSKQNRFDELIIELDKITNKFTIGHANLSYKIIELLEDEIVNSNDKDSFKNYNKLLKVRKKIVNNIKNTPKEIRKNDAKYSCLKEIANKIENLELNVLYNIKSSEMINNYNIVNYIIFNLKNIDYTETLIKNNPYLVNAYSLKTENIFKKTVDGYLDAIEELSREDNYESVCYYDRVISMLLENKYIYCSDDLKRECIKEVENTMLEIPTKKRNNLHVKGWYIHLQNMLSNPNYEIDLYTLNRMFNLDFANNSISKDFNIISRETLKSESIIFTVDDETTFNRDDALSIGRKENGIYNIKIYIADPNFMLKKDSKEMLAARKQCETIYLEDRCIEMFSPSIIKKYLSLDKNKKRPVKIYDYLIDSDGELIDFNIRKEQIKVDKNYSYNRFNKLLKKCDSLKEEQMIDNLLIIKKVLNKEISSENIERQFNKTFTKAELLIATYMIYNNYKVAQYFSDKCLPFIYRHYSNNPDFDKTSLDKMPLLERQFINRFIDEMNCPPNHASYSVDNHYHDALGILYYTHITSPNRRYADILANDCIDNLYFQDLNSQKVQLFEKYLRKEVEHLNDRLIANKLYSEEYAKYVLKRK